MSMIRLDEVNSSDYNTMISSGGLTSGGTFNKICLSTSWQRTVVWPKPPTEITVVKLSYINLS